MKYTAKMGMTTLIVLIPFVTMWSTASAGGPGFNYHAEVLLEDGTPMNEDVSMYVEVYDAASGGQALWEKFYPIVTINNGDFVIPLGGDDPQSLLTQMEGTDQLWLQFVVQGKQLLPRLGIYQVPFALQAHDASQLDGRPASDYALNNEGFSPVAKSGDYSDLTETPNLAKVALSGDYNDVTDPWPLKPVAISGQVSDLTGSPDALKVLSDMHVANNLQVGGLVDAGQIFKNGAPFKTSPWDDNGHAVSFGGDVSLTETVTAGNINVTGQFLVNGAPMKAGLWDQDGKGVKYGGDGDGHVVVHGDYIRRVQFHYTDGDSDGTGHKGHLDTPFTKHHEDSDLYIQWHDNLRCISASCRWRLRLDGHDCNDPRAIDFSRHSGPNHHDVATNGAICKNWGGLGGPAAGDYTLQIHTEDHSLSYQGWHSGSYIIVEEVWADQR